MGRMNREKMDIKAELERTRLANVEDVGVLNKRFRSQLEKLRQTFEQNHRQLESQYEEQVQQLRIDLELKAKVEVHEIEERKNQHINELLFNHQEAFDEIKTYYNDITHDNLQLIRELKDEIAGMKEREKKNQKRMALLTQENKDLSEPLAKKLEEQRELEEKLKSYTKDKMALKNLKAHHKQLEEHAQEAKQEYRTTEERYRKI